MIVSDIKRSDVGAKTLLQVGLEKGVSPDDLLRGVGLEGLADPNSQIEVSKEQEIALIRNFLKYLGKVPHIGLEVSSQYHLTARGVWGFAVASCMTFRAAAELALQYYDLSEVLSDFTLTEQADYFILDVGADHLPPDIQAFVLERDLAAWINYTHQMRPGGLPFMAVELSMGSGADLDLYRTLLSGIEPQLGAARTRIFIKSEAMDYRLSQADPGMARMYAELCRQHIERRRYKGGMSEKVKAILLTCEDEIPGVEYVASRLHLASRSLRRKLSDEGTSFRALVEEVRQSLAIQMLGTEGVKIEEISTRLGYSEPSSFVHAFKRWKGVSPAQYRRTLKPE